MIPSVAHRRGGLLCNFGLHRRLVVLQALVEVRSVYKFPGQGSPWLSSGRHSIARSPPAPHSRRFPPASGCRWTPNGSARLLFNQDRLQCSSRDDLGERLPGWRDPPPMPRLPLPGQMVFPFFVVQIKGHDAPGFMPQSGNRRSPKILPREIAVRLSNVKINAGSRSYHSSRRLMFLRPSGQQGVSLCSGICWPFQMGAFGERIVTTGSAQPDRGRFLFRYTAATLTSITGFSKSSMWPCCIS